MFSKADLQKITKKAIKKKKEERRLKELRQKQLGLKEASLLFDEKLDLIKYSLDQWSSHGVYSGQVVIFDAQDDIRKENQSVYHTKKALMDLISNYMKNNSDIYFSFDDEPKRFTYIELDWSENFEKKV